MSYISDLRKAITNSVLLKDASREAGAGLWTLYVRATMWNTDVSDGDTFVARATEVAKLLEAEKPMTKAEKNSVASAKSVLKGAAERGVDVWRRDDKTGAIDLDPNGDPIPRGKSELQNDKPALDRIMKAIGAAIGVAEEEGFTGLDEEGKTAVALKVKDLCTKLGIGA